MGFGRGWLFDPSGFVVTLLRCLGGQSCIQEHSNELDPTLISWAWNINTTTLLAYRFAGSLAMGGRPSSSLLLLGSRVDLYIATWLM